MLNPYCFYLVNNLFATERLLEIYKHYDQTVTKTLWSCLQLDDVAACEHVTLVAETIMSLPGQWGLGVQKLEELALVGPLAKTISLCIEGHPALVYFLPQFKLQVTALLERLSTTVGGRNSLTLGTTVPQRRT